MWFWRGTGSWIWPPSTRWPCSPDELAARLRSEGIDVQLRGAVDGGPYGLTVGAMARVDVWVPEDQLDDAWKRRINEADWR